jgi:hypothetical protein
MILISCSIKIRHLFQTDIRNIRKHSGHDTIIPDKVIKIA